MRDLERDVGAPGGVQAAPARAEVLGLEVALRQETAPLLRLPLPQQARALVVVLEELMGLVEVVVNSHVEPVPRLEVHDRSCENEFQMSNNTYKLFKGLIVT